MNAPSLGQFNVLEGPQRLWYEFIASYFDGGTHEVGLSGVAFPRAEIAFDIGDLTQPLSGVGITVVRNDGTHSEYLNSGYDSQEKLAFDEASWTFYVKAKAPQGGAGNSRYRCREAAQLLYALLASDDAVKPLGQKGMQEVKVSVPVIVPSADYSVGILRVRARNIYGVK